MLSRFKASCTTCCPTNQHNKSKQVEHGRTFEVALVAAVSSQPVAVSEIAFDSHHMLPALLGVCDVLLQVVVQLFERQLCRSARRVCNIVVVRKINKIKIINVYKRFYVRIFNGFFTSAKEVMFCQTLFVCLFVCVPK